MNHCQICGREIKEKKALVDFGKNLLEKEEEE